METLQKYINMKKISTILEENYPTEYKKKEQQKHLLREKEREHMYDQLDQFVDQLKTFFVFATIMLLIAILSLFALSHLIMITN